MTPIRSSSRSRAGGLAFAGLVAAAGSVAASLPGHAAPCSPEVVADVLAPATAQKRSVNLVCDLRLSKKDVVSKQIVLAGKAASGVKLDCDGGTLGDPKSVNATVPMLAIRSRGDTAEAMAEDRPQSVTVQRCRITGGIAVVGLGPNGEAERVKQSSFRAGHTERAQAAAPTDITLSDLTIIATGPSALYLSPGVTGVTLKGSALKGRSNGPAIYLDAESGHNHIVDNTIAVDTKGREQIAVDGSADNEIRDNRLSSLADGGIYLYRNCGEGGTVRHQAPQRNVLEGNEFYYDRYIGVSPSIWLGSRMGLRFYCSKDRGHPFGSSIDDGDHADFNAVIGNRIVRRPADVMIRDTGSKNRVEGNRMIGEPTRP